MAEFKRTPIPCFQAAWLPLPVQCPPSPGPQGLGAPRGRKPQSPSWASLTTAVSGVTSVHSCSEAIQKADSWGGEVRLEAQPLLGAHPPNPEELARWNQHCCLHGTALLTGEGRASRSCDWSPRCTGAGPSWTPGSS